MGKVILEMRKQPLLEQRSSSEVFIDVTKQHINCTQRSVHFKETRSVRPFQKDYDESDYENMWYSRDELDDIAIENNRRIRKANRKRWDRRRRFHDTEEWSWRGFEYATARYGRLKIRNEHVKGVLKHQHKGGLALADHAHSKSSANGSILRARSHAIRDELEAGRIHKEVEDPKSSTYRRCKTF